MQLSEYDYIIIGGGSSGLQMAMAMAENGFLEDSTLLLIEKEAKQANDRTWCFWEKGEGKFDSIVFRQWKQGQFISDKGSIPLDLGAYSYKMIRSADFYALSRKRLEGHKNTYFLKDEVKSVTKEGEVKVSGDRLFTAKQWVFDSRVPVTEKELVKYVSLVQHFLGWVIKTPAPVFESDSFIMMDYRSNKPGTTSFHYVLPFSENEALVEFTFFNDKVIEEQEYEHYLRNYIKKELGIADFEILEVEKGQIPMTDYPFWKHDEGKWLHIGTGGGWVKPSTGYSFRNSGMYTERILEELAEGEWNGQSVIARGKRFYDSVFITVLRDENGKGPDLFYNLYGKVPTQTIFRFLDEESTFGDELLIMSKFVGLDFTKAFFKSIRRFLPF